MLRGAHVLDGTGSQGREMDVSISGDRIIAIGPNLPPGSTEIDLRGLALSPGFIDIHSQFHGLSGYFSIISIVIFGLVLSFSS